MGCPQIAGRNPGSRAFKSPDAVVAPGGPSIRPRLAPLLALALLVPSTGAEPQAPEGAAGERYLVAFVGDVPVDAPSHVASLGGIVDFVSPGEPAFLAARAPPGDPEAFLSALRARPDVLLVEPDEPVHALHTPNDPLLRNQWAPSAIGLPRAWDVARGDRSVKVAILDTGIALGHPDLDPNLCGRSPDFTAHDWKNLHWHGTHVAGIAGAALDNAVGIAGAGNVCLLDVRVLGPSGAGSWGTVAAGVKWAADEGADVLSMSLGGPQGGSTLGLAITYASVARGVLVVAAAGNSGCGPDTTAYPARHREAVAVASLDSATARSGFSSCGPQVEIAAPGGGILSTMPWGYGTASGTSMATPYVSGVAALAVPQARALAITAPKNLILRCALAVTADDLGDAGRDPKFGFGRLDAAELVAGGVAAGAARIPECLQEWHA